VAGGPLFVNEYHLFPAVDHFVLNEARNHPPPLSGRPGPGEAKPLYTTSEFADILQSPPPRWELLELDRYAMMSIQYSRGCPYNCDFCNVTVLFGHRPRIKSAAQIITELDSLYRLGWRGKVFFCRRQPDRQQKRA